MPELEKIWGIIPAAGTGLRMGEDVPKQYLKIHGKCILEYTLVQFCDFPRIDGVVVVLAANDTYWPTLSVSTHEKIHLTTGGEQRCNSVLNGLRSLQKLAAPRDWVLVHDAARPCIRVEDIDKLINRVSKGSNGGLLAVPVRNTIKRASRENCVKETVDREGLWHALTPQMFRLAELTEAIESALRRGLLVTDEAQAMEIMKVAPLLVEGHPDNIKITHPQDLLLAEQFLSQHEGSV